MSVTAPNMLINVITDFLAGNPTSEQIVAFRLPEAIEQHALELLEHRRQETLTAEERIEFDEYIRMEQFMSILKAKARLRLMKRE